MNEQITWAKADGFLDIDGDFKPDDFKTTGMSYWLKEIYKSLHHRDVRALKFQTKDDTRVYIRGCFIRELKELTVNKTSLKFCDSVWGEIDYEFCNFTQRWWLKLHTGAIFVNSRKKYGTDANKLCPMKCGNVETLDHFL